jgi:hypothetical protein
MGLPVIFSHVAVANGPDESLKPRGATSLTAGQCVSQYSHSRIEPVSLQF